MIARIEALCGTQVAPLRFGGTSREKMVVVAIGGAGCTGKSWLAGEMEKPLSEGGMGALVLSLDALFAKAPSAAQAMAGGGLAAMALASRGGGGVYGSVGPLPPPPRYELEAARACLRALRKYGSATVKLPDQEEAVLSLPKGKVVVIEGLFALHPVLAAAADVRAHCTGSVHVRTHIHSCAHALSLSLDRGL